MKFSSEWGHVNWLTHNRGVTFIAIYSHSNDHNKGHYANADNQPRIASAIEAGGGKLEAFYWALGPDDFYVILEAPSHLAVAAVSMSVIASGAIEHSHTTPLLTAEEVDEAAKIKIPYKAPGQ